MRTFLYPRLLPLLIVLGGCSKSPVVETENEGQQQQQGKSAKAAPVDLNLKYEIKSDAVTITGCDMKASGALIIPTAIKGKSVTSIGADAFWGSTSLTSITIGSSVTSIGDGAFYDCASLTGITIPDSVTSIGVWAFGECRSLTSVTIGDSVTSIGGVPSRNAMD